MRTVCIIFIFCFVSACSSRDYIVNSDYSYRGHFHKYRSFDFAVNSNFSGSDREKEIVEKYMNRILTSWGYDLSHRKPDLMIFYSIYYADLNFHGFNQPEFHEWLRLNYSDEDIVFKRDTMSDGGREEIFLDQERTSKYRGEEYDPVIYILKEGTVLISLFDRKRRKTVWHGYASGIFGENLQQNDRILKSAIIQIMDEYRLLAFDAS